MENELNDTGRQVDLGKVGLEYRLELIAFHDRLFQARRKLKESKDKMEALEQKLQDYLRNKENQIAEVMLSAHINAQRIEAQTRTQVEYLLREMERESGNTQRLLDLLEGKVTPPQPEVPVKELVRPTSEAGASNIQARDVVRSIFSNKTATAERDVDSVAAVQSEVEKGSDYSLPPSDIATDQPMVPDVPKEPTPKVCPRSHRRFRRKIGYKAIIKPRQVKEQDPEENMVNIFTGKQDEMAPQDISREQQERIRCDAFVDVRYYSNVQTEQVTEHHALYVAAEVIVPASNYAVRYTKVSADVVATLMRYDNVVLNEVYPFDIIEPNLNNIAKYFFNCVQDVLALMDLGLHSLTIHELPDLRLEITSRSRDLDRQMHTNEDMLQDIRRDLPDQVIIEPEPPSNLKSRLSQILKKR